MSSSRRASSAAPAVPTTCNTLTSIVPTAANAGYYAGIVSERAILRRLVDAGTRIVQLGYAGEGDATDNRQTTPRPRSTRSPDPRPPKTTSPCRSPSMPPSRRSRPPAGRDGSLTGVPTGFKELDELTNGLHGGQMIVVAARPAMGKSSLALDFARSASIGHNLPSVFFSLEMGKSEIAMRLLSAAEGAIPLQNMRKGKPRPARLDHRRRDPRPHQRRPALHRRQPEHDARRDPCQVPSTQAAEGPAQWSSSTTCSS